MAQAAGFRPGEGQPPERSGPWLDQNHPAYESTGAVVLLWMSWTHSGRRFPPRLRDVCPTTAWRRLRQERGLQASLTSFRRYVHHHTPQAVALQQITVHRPDPPPGEEAQVDYGLLGMWINPLIGRRQAVNAFALVLSHGRHTFACAVCRMDQPTWLECHKAAFSFFGGVPRRLVPDNLKSGIPKADLYDPSFNRGYQELAQLPQFRRRDSPGKALRPHLAAEMGVLRADLPHLGPVFAGSS